MNVELIIKECIIKFVKSSGAGGQNVNKVATQAQLFFDVLNSKALSEAEKKFVIASLSNKISSEGILQIQNQSERTQLANKELAIQIFLMHVLKAIKPKKKRVKTKTPKAVKEKRKKSKKQLSDKKINRKKINPKDI